MTVRALTAPGARLGEGPVWDAGARCLWWVDILGRRLHAWDGAQRQWELPWMASLATPRGDGTLVLVTEAGLATFDPATGATGRPVPFEAGLPGNRSNDSKVSPGGTLVAGTMGRRFEPGAGAFHAIRVSGEARCLIPDVTISNGLAWSPDGRFIHYTDSPTRKLMRAPWDEATASIGPPELLFEVAPPVAPDGAAMAADGTIWVALWDGHRVVGVAPDGALVGEIALPVAQVTACAFGGEDLRTLFITSAGEGDRAPLAGSLFAVEMAVPGVPVPGFSWAGPAGDG
jgi:sugar lactone lactonase YvrE